MKLNNFTTIQITTFTNNHVIYDESLYRYDICKFQMDSRYIKII